MHAGRPGQHTITVAVAARVAVAWASQEGGRAAHTEDKHPPDVRTSTMAPWSTPSPDVGPTYLMPSFSNPREEESAALGASATITAAYFQIRVPVIIKVQNLPTGKFWT